MSVAWTINNTWLPFLRAVYAEGGGAIYDRSVSVGLGYLTSQRDLIGLGLNCARPQGLPAGAKTGGQFTLETFYRNHVSEEFAVTADVQLINNPAPNPNKDTIGYFGMRARLAL